MYQEGDCRFFWSWFVYQIWDFPLLIIGSVLSSPFLTMGESPNLEEEAFASLIRSLNVVGEKITEKKIIFVKRVEYIPKLDMTSLEAKRKYIIMHERALGGKFIELCQALE